MLPRVLVLVRRADDAVHVLLGRKRHGASDLRAGTRHRVDDLPRRAVDDLMVIGLEPDADLLSRHVASMYFASVVPLSARWPPLAGCSGGRHLLCSRGAAAGPDAARPPRIATAY